MLKKNLLDNNYQSRMDNKYGARIKEVNKYNKLCHYLVILRYIK